MVFMRRFVSMRTISTMLTLSLLLMSWVPIAESSPEIRIDFIETFGPPVPGTIVEVGGSGAEFEGEVEILFDSMSVALTSADGGGDFYATFEVPDVPPGEYTITAVDKTLGYTASRPFYVELQITIFIDPDRGYTGATVFVFGEMATPGGIVEIYFDETLVAETTADPFGFYFAMFAVPDVPPGVYQVTALDVRSGSSASVEFEVLPPPELSLSPNEGPMGTKVTVSGKGFVSPVGIPGIPTFIYIFFEDNLVAYGRLDENGDFTVNITVPAVATGTYEVKTVFEPGSPITSATFSVTFGTDTLFAQLEKMDDLSAQLENIGSDITALNARITSVEGDVVTIKTDLGEIKGRVTSIEGNIMTIETDVGTLKVEVPQRFEALTEETQEQFGSVITYELTIVILALIAAIGAWIAVIMVWRKSKAA